MSAPACSRRWLAPIAALVLSGSLYAVAQVPQVPQAQKSAAPVVKRGEAAPPPQSVDGRYGIQVLASTVNVHAEATSGSAVLAELQRETGPGPDRWRIVDQLGIVNQRVFDPYNPNTLKGDRPVFGEDWFFNLGVISDTLFEARKLPTPIGAQSSQDPQANDQFGRGRQSTFAQNLIVSLSLLKGSTTFKPPELEFRLVPVLNYNVSKVEEVRALRIDPRSGTRRTDHFAAIQEAFVDYEYNIASEYFDFDDIRVGIQPFISDFRGCLFQDQPVGIRFFG